VLDTFSSFNEPSRAIPEEAIKLHGITNVMADGHKIDGDAVTAFVSDAIIIAHNAAFDRKFAERYWPVLAVKPWACSVNQIEWRAHGFEGSRLGYLLSGIGMFHKSHRAVDDCHALLEILAHTIPDVDRKRARPLGGFAQAVATSKASSLPESLRSAPGRGSSFSARSRLPSTKRRLVRYTVEPPTATARAISSSLRPASAASNIWARLSLRAARLPLLNIAVSSQRSAWLNSTR
jgi:DNA polymerase III epsilon subunit-like protein